jgi:hypothetical protein
VGQSSASKPPNSSGANTSVPQTNTPIDLYRTGTSPSGPKGASVHPARIGKDITPDVDGMLPAQSKNGNWPNGMSTFDSPTNFPGQHVYRPPAGSPLPKGFDVVADGLNVKGSQPIGHHTIFNTEVMPASTFNQTLTTVNNPAGLPWTYFGKVP